MIKHSLKQLKPLWFYTMSNYQKNALYRLIKSNSQACTKDIIPQGYGEFGLMKTNPIPVYGEPEIKTYLSRLRLKNSEKICCQATGDVKASNIQRPIKRYEIYKPSGKLITILHFSPYHLKTSSKAPKGFRLNEK